MGFMDRLKKAIQPDDNDYDGSPDEMYDYDDDPILNNNIPNANNIYSQNNNNQNYNQTYNPNDYGGQNSGLNQSSNVAAGGPVSSTVSLRIAKPKKFTDSTQIANDLLNGRTIFMLLDETESKEVARRLVDFLAGVAYAVDGKVRSVNPTTIIIAPNEADISKMSFDTEKMRRANSGDDTFD